MKDTTDKNTLRIKKYSNRRYYDTTRSCHVTLTQMHSLICDGYTLEILDSQTGDDITNQVLTQILLERDPPKLGIFPADILHQMIRTQQQFLGGVVEQFFAQVLNAHRSSQDGWMRFLRNTVGFGQDVPANPLDWTRNWMAAFFPGVASPGRAGGAAGSPPEPPSEPHHAPDKTRVATDSRQDELQEGRAEPADDEANRRREIEELRDRIAELTDVVEGLRRGPSSDD